MDHNANQIIDRLGGTVEVARLFDITKGAVSQWRENGIPHARLMFLKLARPELFDMPSQTKEAA
ncbi:MAG: Cro/CI family transcriptional regulator [Fluviibacter sp.]